MKKETLEVVRGSGNVFRDFGHKSADVLQLKAILAAEIIKTLDREKLSVRAAHVRTGIAAADFSRIRGVDLGRFTIDRLMSIVDRLGSRIELTVRFKRADRLKHLSTPVRAQKAQIRAAIQEADAGRFATPRKVKALFHKWKAT